MNNEVGILYIGSFYEESRYEEIWTNSRSFQVFSGHTFQNALLHGFVFNENKNINYIINAPAIGSYPFRYKKIYYRKSSFSLNGVKGINCSFLNLTLIKNMSIYYSMKREIKRWYLNNNSKRKILIVYSLIPSYLFAALDIKKQFSDVYVCVIILDLPQYFGDNSSYVYNSYIKLITKNINDRINEADSFVLLTKQMADALKIPPSKSFIVIEGVYKDNAEISFEKLKKTILYSGKLDKRFGIYEMLESFTMIEDKGYNLLICGGGIDKELVQKYCKIDNRIKYLGVMHPAEVYKLQSKATLLINPRNPSGEYTKYSFPSKTMEYMASGTPTVMYRLPGMPDEYSDFLILLKDTSLTTLKDTLIEWCEKDEQTLHNYGIKARDFILKNKNANVQAKKIIDLINNDIYS